MDYYLDNTKVFKALGDPKRAMIVDMLSCGELCACMILEKFEMSQSTLDKTKQFFCSATSDKENCISKDSSNCCKGCNENE